jgi:type I restriction enzyme S subunit
MNIEWRNVELGDHVDFLTGFPFKSAKYLDDCAGAVRLLRGDNVGQGTLRWDGAKHWPEAERAEYSQFELRERDVILAMDRPWIEAGLKYAWVRSADQPCFLVQRVTRMRGINGLSTDYLRYVIGSQEFTAHVKSITTGVNVPHISGGDIKRFRFLMPPPAQQASITSILGAYDDLIEVNLRRIALLEEIARRLFEEWFVRFRFPGHESCAMIETKDGPLPQGWHRDRLDEVAKVNADTIRPANAPERIGYVDIASVVRGDIQAVEWQAFADAPGRARRRVRDGSIIWSMVRPNRRSHALVIDPDDNLIVSTGFAVLDPRGISSDYLYQYVTTDAFVGYLVGNATGAAYPAVTGATFERALVLLPPMQLDREFSRIVDPMMRQVDALRKTNVRLSASRNLLLPRLISGEFDIPTAEHELEAVA